MGVYKRYILYSCVVCGKQTGDKSKHHKHERACKKKIFADNTQQAEKEEGQLDCRQVADDRATSRRREVGGQSSSAEAQRVAVKAEKHLTEYGSCSSRLKGSVEASLLIRRKAEEEAKRRKWTGAQKELTRSQLQPLIARELKAVYHWSGCNAPDTCLHSRRQRPHSHRPEGRLPVTQTCGISSAQRRCRASVPSSRPRDQLSLAEDRTNCRMLTTEEEAFFSSGCH